MLTAIVKKEYYGKIVVLDLNEISFMEYDDSYGIFIAVKNSHSTAVEINRNEKDYENALKTMFLDIYSTWKKYVENIQFIQEAYE